jgi:hypothetical protein
MRIKLTQMFTRTAAATIGGDPIDDLTGISREPSRVIGGFRI